MNGTEHAHNTTYTLCRIRQYLIQPLAGGGASWQRETGRARPDEACQPLAPFAAEPALTHGQIDRSAVIDTAHARWCAPPAPHAALRFIARLDDGVDRRRRIHGMYSKDFSSA